MFVNFGGILKNSPTVSNNIVNPWLLLLLNPIIHTNIMQPVSKMIISKIIVLQLILWCKNYLTHNFRVISVQKIPLIKELRQAKYAKRAV